MACDLYSIKISLTPANYRMKLKEFVFVALQQPARLKRTQISVGNSCHYYRLNPADSDVSRSDHALPAISKLFKNMHSLFWSLHKDKIRRDFCVLCYLRPTQTSLKCPDSDNISGIKLGHKSIFTPGYGANGVYSVF